jgi:hypothetical protein
MKAEKGQRKNLNLGWHKDRKENPMSAPSIHPSIHPSTLVHWWVLADSLWPAQWAGSVCERTSETLTMYFVVVSHA